MIAPDEQTNSITDAGNAFSEWASNFSEGLFVMLKVYADETGTHDAVHQEYVFRDFRIGGIAFESDKDEAHLGLQAADFSAMRFRNISREFIEREGRLLGLAGTIDFLINKNVDVEFRMLPKDRVSKLINDMRAHENYVRKRGFKGTYFPLKDFPFKKYGYK